MTNNKKLIKTYLVEVIIETNYDNKCLFAHRSGVHAMIGNSGAYFSNKKKAIQYYNGVVTGTKEYEFYSETTSKSMYEFEPKKGVWHEIK